LIFETDRLIIRQITLSDVDDLHEYLSLPETYVFEPGEPLNLEETRALLEERTKEGAFFAVVLKPGDKMIGHLFFEQVGPQEWLTWEIGYVFNPRYQRMGYGSEAVSGLVVHAFSQMHAHRVMARCNPQNIASWKLLEKVGFVREGCFKKNAFFHVDESGNPLWTDTFEYSMLEKG
jgi:[ribosomal protein S5]-alanine N-acetyltransferase